MAVRLCLLTHFRESHCKSFIFALGRGMPGQTDVAACVRVCAAFLVVCRLIQLGSFSAMKGDLQPLIQLTICREFPFEHNKVP